MRVVIFDKVGTIIADDFELFWDRNAQFLSDFNDQNSGQIIRSKNGIWFLTGQDIFASDDLTAILVIKIAQELGISVPEELKVIGYDGTYFIENYYPQLATIKQPLEEIACLTVDLLLQKIEGKEVATTGYFLPVTLLPGKVFNTQ